MHYKSGLDRGQLILFSTLEDGIEEDNPVRLIDMLIESLFKQYPERFVYKGCSCSGQKSYSPSTLLKLYLYGYLNRISSSRRLERETHRNIEVKWLLCDLRPDFKTIADFRKDNKEAIRFVTLRFREFLIGEGYIKGHKITYDGSKIKACTSKDRVLTTSSISLKLRNLEKQLETYLEQLSGNDHAEDLQKEMESLCEDLGIDRSMAEEISSLKSRIVELERIQKELESSPHTSYCPNDPDAHLMKSRDGYIPAYNLQTGTDAENKMIILAEVTDDVNDIGQLKEDYDQTIAQAGITPQTVLADSGYCNFDQIEAIESIDQESCGIPQTQCIIPVPDSPAKEKDRQNGISFIHDPQADIYTCVKGKKLTRKNRTVTHGNTVYHVYQANSRDCHSCPLWNKCTSAKNGRAIKIPKDQEFRKKYMDRVNRPENRKLIKERKNLIEHVFGTLKRWMGKVPILLTSQKKVQIEIDLYTTAYNIRRLVSMEDVPVLVQKLRNYSF